MADFKRHKGNRVQVVATSPSGAGVDLSWIRWSIPIAGTEVLWRDVVVPTSELEDIATEFRAGSTYTRFSPISNRRTWFQIVSTSKGEAVGWTWTSGGYKRGAVLPLTCAHEWDAHEWDEE